MASRIFRAGLKFLQVLCLIPKKRVEATIEEMKSKKGDEAEVLKMKKSGEATVEVNKMKESDEPTTQELKLKNSDQAIVEVTKHTQIQLLYLPTDILSDILSRLPAASLHRLKSVSKQWLQTISDPYFAELQRTRQSSFEFDLIYTSCRHARTKINTFLQISTRCIQQRTTPDAFPADAQVIGSCKGLVLLQRPKDFYVVNPITGDSRRLVDRFRSFFCVPLNAGIGCDPSTGQCKVVVVYSDSERKVIRCRALTLQGHGCSAWRELDVSSFESLTKWRELDVSSFESLKNSRKCPVFANGSLHWIFSHGIISLDLEQEKFQQTNLPFEISGTVSANFMEWDGCLGAVPNFLSRSCYILRKSGWSKQQVDITLFKNRCPSKSYYKDYLPYPVTSLRNGQVIIFKEIGDQNNFHAYHIGSGAVTHFTAKAPFGGSMFDWNVYYQVGAIIAHVDELSSIPSFGEL